MYVDSMTVDEMVNELRKDIALCQSFISHKLNGEIRRRIITCKRFPMIKLYDWKSPRGNRYIIVFYSKDRKQANHKTTVSDVSFYAVLNDGNIFDANQTLSEVQCIDIAFGKLVGTVVPSMYYSHFFHRYEERFGLLPGYTDIRHQFVARHLMSSTYTSAIKAGVFTVNHGENAELLNIWKDGLSLGGYCDMELYKFKTYLPFDADFTEKQKLYFNEISNMHIQFSDACSKLQRTEDKKTYYVN